MIWKGGKLLSYSAHLLNAVYLLVINSHQEKILINTVASIDKWKICVFKLIKLNYSE